MEFKSQICTTKEQSEKLLAAGLKKETADMVHYFSRSLAECWTIVPLDDGEVAGNDDLEIPAWSLHRLIEMSLNLSNGVAYCYTAGSNMNVTYDEVIDMIEWAISKECFNKDYLEESQCEK